MTREEMLGVLLRLDTEQEVEWMIDLGHQLTICARGSYPFEQTPGEFEHLVGFNELHHKVYARIGDVRRGHVWTMESFFEGLVQLALHYRIGGDLHQAITNTLERVKPREERVP